MKKVCGILMMLVCGFAGAQAQSVSWTELRGKWVSDDGEGLEIADSSTVYLLYKGEKKSVSGCTANLGNSPCWFDFSVKDSAEQIQVKSILQRVNTDTIRWQVFEGDRPSGFDPSRGDIIVLRRKP